MSLLKHITTVYANGRIPVHKYRSESTGLHVVIGKLKDFLHLVINSLSKILSKIAGEVDGPLVNGFFSLGNLILNSYFRKMPLE